MTINNPEIKSLGTDTQNGNIVGVQPFMQPNDYSSPTFFEQALQRYIDLAAQHGFISDKTVLVFPEYIGTWLAFCGQKDLPDYTKIADIIGQIIQSNYSGFIEKTALGKEQDTTLAGFFRMQSPAMAQIYQDSFSRLARKNDVTLVAGSVLLADPHVGDGRLLTADGPIYNLSTTFHSDGQLDHNLVKKIYLVPAETPFLTPGQLNELAPLTSPVGKLGVLVCADSWYSEPYQQLRNIVDWFVVPSYQNEPGLWNQPWRGYPPNQAVEYDRSDIGHLTEGQAWQKYALSARIRHTSATGGINVFLKGNLWDMGADSGYSSAILGSEKVEITTPFAGLLNLWIPQK